MYTHSPVTLLFGYRALNNSIIYKSMKFIDVWLSAINFIVFHTLRFLQQYLNSIILPPRHATTSSIATSTSTFWLREDWILHWNIVPWLMNYRVLGCVSSNGNNMATKKRWYTSPAIAFVTNCKPKLSSFYEQLIHSKNHKLALHKIVIIFHFIKSKIVWIRVELNFFTVFIQLSFQLKSLGLSWYSNSFV